MYRKPFWFFAFALDDLFFLLEAWGHEGEPNETQDMINKFVGHGKFLVLYIACMVVADFTTIIRFKNVPSYASLGASGAICERLAANEHAVFPMPKGLSYEQAAGISITYFTSYYALKQRANIQPGETLLVLGAAGGVGTTAIELGKMMGARVIAAASTAEKLELCRSLGADEVINYSEVSLKDAIKELTGGKGVDVVYDPEVSDHCPLVLEI